MIDDKTDEYFEQAQKIRDAAIDSFIYAYEYLQKLGIEVQDGRSGIPIGDFHFLYVEGEDDQPTE